MDAHRRASIRYEYMTRHRNWLVAYAQRLRARRGIEVPEALHEVTRKIKAQTRAMERLRQDYWDKDCDA